MKEYQDAISKIEAMRGKAPEVQQAAIDMALTMLRRADETATPALIAEYHGIREYALSKLQSNEECESPHRKIAEMIIMRLLEN